MIRTSVNDWKSTVSPVDVDVPLPAAVLLPREPFFLDRELFADVNDRERELQARGRISSRQTREIEQN